MTETRKAALAYTKAGLSVIPVKGRSASTPEDKKRPALREWKSFQGQIADITAHPDWFRDLEWIGVVTGKVSGGLEVIDFDVPGKHEAGFEVGQAPLWEPFIVRCEECGLGELLQRLTVCSTPSGGKHLAYRCHEIAIPGSMKLAMAGIDGRVETLIETRGEGGYFVVSPSSGYSFDSGNLEEVAEISAEEREALHGICRSLNRHWSNPVGPAKSEAGPGHDYNNRGPSCVDQLERHGWKISGSKGGWINLCRPGKSSGISGGVSVDGGTFYVFSTNAESFEAGKPYSRFAVYALLEHGGDFGAAARALASQGYGRTPDRKGSEGAGDFSFECTRYRMQSIGELLEKEPEEESWLVEGLLLAGGTSLVAAKPKVGKSTLLRWLAFCVARGMPFLGKPTRQGKVFYLAIEEKEAQVIEKFRAMGASVDDPIHIHVGQAPAEALKELLPLIEKERPDLVIIDPLLKFVRVPDANDYARLSAALEPVIEASRRSGAHFALSHHNGKGQRDDGDNVLGSTAIFGAVDTLVSLKKSGGHRTVSTTNRYGEDLEETVLALNQETSEVTLGAGLEQTQMRNLQDRIAEHLALEPGTTENDLKAKLGGNTGLVGQALRDGLAEARFARSGGGRRCNPFLYSLTSDVSFSCFPNSEKRENEKTRNVEVTVD